MHPACLSETDLLTQCQVKNQRQKGSGAGGQRKNKVESAIQITHVPTGTTAQAAERRDRAANLKAAIFRLRLTLAIHSRGGFDLAAGPTARWTQRVRGAQLAINAEHTEFPALMAEAMTVMEQQHWDPADTGRWLRISTTQLIKFLSKAPAALEEVNRQREAIDVHPLRFR